MALQLDVSVLLNIPHPQLAILVSVRKEPEIQPFSIGGGKFEPYTRSETKDWEGVIIICSIGLAVYPDVKSAVDVRLEVKAL